MKEEKIYNVRYSESKGKIKLYLEPKKLVFKKIKGLFKKETIIVDTILLDDIKFIIRNIYLHFIFFSFKFIFHQPFFYHFYYIFIYFFFTNIHFSY